MPRLLHAFRCCSLLSGARTEPLALGCDFSVIGLACTTPIRFVTGRACLPAISSPCQCWGALNDKCRLSSVSYESPGNSPTSENGVVLNSSINLRALNMFKVRGGLAFRRGVWNPFCCPKASRTSWWADFHSPTGEWCVRIHKTYTHVSRHALIVHQI